jgi:hypothetical protein
LADRASATPTVASLAKCGPTSIPTWRRSACRE